MKSQVVRRGRRGFIGLVVIWSAVAGVAAPTEYIWTGAQDAYWTNAANWAVGGVAPSDVPGRYLTPGGEVTNLDAVAVFDATGGGRATVWLDGHLCVSSVVFRAGAPVYTLGEKDHGRYFALAHEGGRLVVEPGARAPVIEGVVTLVYSAGMASNVSSTYDQPGEARYLNYADEPLVLRKFGNRGSGFASSAKTRGWYRYVGLGGTGDIRVESWEQNQSVVCLNYYPEGAGKVYLRGTTQNEWLNQFVRCHQVGGGRKAVVEIYQDELQVSQGENKSAPLRVYGEGSELRFVASGNGRIGLRGFDKAAASASGYGEGYLRAAADVEAGARLVLDCPLKSYTINSGSDKRLEPDPRDGLYFHRGSGTIVLGDSVANSCAGGVDLTSNAKGATLAFERTAALGSGPVRIGRAGCLAFVGAEDTVFDRDLVLTNKSINVFYEGMATIAPTAVFRQAGAGALTVASTLDVVAGAADQAMLVLDSASAAPATWAGVLRDSSDGQELGRLKVVKTGAGTWTLGAGAHTFSGGLDVAGGTLALAAEATLAAPVTLANDTTLTLAQSQRLAALNVSGTARIVLADGVELTLGSVVAAAGARLKIVPGTGARVRIEGVNAIPDYLFVCGADGRSVGSAIDAEGWIAAAAPTVWTGAAAADWTAEGNWSRGVPSTALPARIDSPDATPVVPAGTTAPTAGTIDLAAGTLKVLGTLPVTIAEETARFVVGSAATLALAGAGQVQANAAAGVNDYALALAGGMVTVQDTAHLDLTGSRGLLGTGRVTIDSGNEAALYVMGASAAFTRLSTGDDPGTLEIVTGRGGFYGKADGYLVIGDDQRGTLRMRVTDAGAGKDSAAVVAGSTPRRTTIGARRGRAEVELASGTLNAGNWGIWLGAADTGTSAVTGRVTVAGGRMSISSGYYDGSWSGLAVGIASQQVDPACVAGELILSSGSVSVGNKSPLGLGIAAACGLVRQTGGTFTMSANQGVTVLGYGSGTGVWEMSGGTFSSSRPLYIGGCSKEELQLSPAFSAPAACAPGRRAAHGRFAAQGGTITLTHELGAIVGADGPGRLEIGAEAVFTTPALTLKGADATLAFVLGTRGAGTLEATNVAVEEGAKLVVDATQLASTARARIRLVGSKAHTGDFAPEQVTIITAPANAWRFASYSLAWVDGETDGGLYLQLQPRGMIINVR